MPSHIKQRGKRGTWWYYGHWKGRRYRESLETTVKRDAEAIQRQRDALYDDDTRTTRVTKTVNVDAIWRLDDEYVGYDGDTGLYIDWMREHRDPDTIAIQRIFWAALMDHTRRKRLSSITRQDVDSLKRKHVRSGKWSEVTANNFLKDIKAIFNRCIREGWYTGENPAEGVERFTVTRRDPEPHSREEMEALLEAASDVDQYTEWVVLLGGWAGLRKAEIFNARWEWFNFDTREPTIHVRRHPDFPIKDRAERVIAMSKRISKSMKHHAKKSGYVFESTRRSEGRDRYRFNNKRSVLSALKAAGLRTDDPFQRLRISFTCMHAEAGTDIYRVSKWLGHSSVRVTEAYYASVRGYDKDIDNV